MKENFANYNQSIALRDLGFDEECLGFYKDSKYLKTVDQHWGMSLGGISKSLGYSVDDLVLAPLISQVFTFFRKKYNLSGEVQSNQFKFTYYIIYDTLGNNVCKFVGEKYNTYPEAQTECINKLIKIAQENENR